MNIARALSQAAALALCASATISVAQEADNGFDGWADEIIAAAEQNPEGEDSDAAAVHDAAAPCAIGLATGDILTGELPVLDYPHRLIIENGQNKSDAFVKLVGIDSPIKTLFFVAGGTRAELSNIPDGRYDIAFALGGTLAADCETVIRPRSTEKFPETQTFATERTEESIKTGVLSFTLFEVQSGNVAPVGISVAEFNED